MWEFDFTKIEIIIKKKKLFINVYDNFLYNTYFLCV